MHIPERRTSQSRRSHEQPQQQQQQYSPFRRARRESNESDASLIPSPSRSSSSAHYHRRNFSQTGTLRGAFEVASRLPVKSGTEDGFLRSATAAAPYRSSIAGTPDRRRRRTSIYSTMSPDSNPPDELVEAYRRIDGEGSLNDLGADDEESHNFPARVSDQYRTRRLSSGSSIRENGGFLASDASFTDDSPRRRTVDYNRDELRLKRATSSRSPVFSRAGNTPALTSDNLQRREEELHRMDGEDEEDGLRPPMNLPSTWGSRGKHRQDWLKNLTRNHGIGLGSNAEGEAEVQEEYKETRPRQPLADVGSNIGVPEPASAADRNTRGDGSVNRRDKRPLAETLNNISFEYNSKLGDGSHIPNTPVVVYKNSTFNKRSPSKRDSQDLLRKLSRTESPPQSQSQLKTPEQPARGRGHIYDKTPVVTGAWIDTPMTERASGFPDHLTKDIIPSSTTKFKSERPPEPTDRRVDQNSTSNTDWRPKWPRESYKPSTERLEELPEESERPDELKEQVKKEEKPQESKGKGREGQQKENKTEDIKGRSENEKHSKPAQNKRPLIKPDLPKSALETVLQDHMDNKDPLDVGDDTIESLQIIMDGQPTEVKEEEEEDAAYEKAVLEKLELAHSGAPDEVDLDRLNGKLKSLSDNINNVKVGLTSLEDQVSRDNDTLASIPRSPMSPSPTVCLHADSGHHDGRIYASIPLPRLWKRDPDSRSIRPTRLGWCAAILLTWFFSESTMCDYYCHPFVATVCEGNCLLPDAPRFPFVIPTMLWRWFHVSTIITPIWAIILAVFRLSAQLLGFWDGYVDEGPPQFKLSGEIWIHGSRVGDIPTVATPTPSSQQNQWNWNIANRYTPPAVPDIEIEANTAGENWEDRSMDDDEFI